MNIFEFADRLNGREMGSEITFKEEVEAKKNGFVVVCGASDDLCEFYGAIHQEVDIDGTEILYIFKDRVVKIHRDEDNNPKIAVPEGSVPLQVILNGDGPLWDFRLFSKCFVAWFTIYSYGEPYCNGIVFDLKRVMEK